MKRRNFLTLAASGGTYLSGVARAQEPPRVWRVGLLAGASRPKSIESHYYGAFLRRMNDLGYREGRNLAMEWRFADGNYDRLFNLATELVERRVDVIVTTLTLGAKMAQKATKTIPIVMAYSADPVGFGVVASLNRPGGNVTGLTSSVEETTSKQLELLSNVVPHASRISILLNPDNLTHPRTTQSAQTSAMTLGLRLVPVEARNASELESSLVRTTMRESDGLLVLNDSLFLLERQRIADFAITARLPTMFGVRDFVEAGGLMSYGDSLAEFFRQAATYVDKVLKGAKPEDLPVEQPTRFFLAISLKTAKKIGLEIGQVLLLRADEVIE